MVGGLILVPLISLITPKQNKNEVNAMFECYQKDVTVKATESLGK